MKWFCKRLAICYTRPEFPEGLFTTQSHLHSLRSCEKSNQPTVNTNKYSLHMLQYEGAKIWNEMPVHINTLRPRQNGHHFQDDTFKCISLNENVWISIEISLKFVRKGSINNIPALVQIMVGADQVTSHYLDQWWLDYRRIYASLGLSELKAQMLCGSCTLCNINALWFMTISPTLSIEGNLQAKFLLSLFYTDVYDSHLVCNWKSLCLHGYLH